MDPCGSTTPTVASVGHMRHMRLNDVAINCVWRLSARL